VDGLAVHAFNRCVHGRSGRSRRKIGGFAADAFNNSGK